MKIAGAGVVLTRTADMRYVGQFHEVEVEMASGRLVAEHVEGATANFHKRHHELYSFSMTFRGVEFLNFRVRATAQKAPFKLEEVPRGDKSPQGALKRRRNCIFNGRPLDTPVFEGEKIQAGNVIAGPAIIEEKTTTVVVPPSFDCSTDRFKTYVLRRRQG
ncbi:MAG: hypothetical protein ACE5JQ_07620 [Candidatus Methylomirabilales bacterium]